MQGRQQTLSLRLTAPDQSYTLEFMNVYRDKVNNKLIAVLELSASGNQGEAVAHLAPTITVRQEGLHATHVEYYVLNVKGFHPYEWRSKNFTVITNLNILEQDIKGLEMIYERPPVVPEIVSHLK